MNIHGILDRSPRHLRRFLFLFVLALTIGYSAGMLFLYRTTELRAQGVEENYLGNEHDEEAETMKFKMPEKQMLNIVHSHLLSYSLILLALGLLMAGTSYPLPLQRFFMLEPFIMLILTFGGLWSMWHGWTWMKHVVTVSGALLTLGFYGQIGLVLISLGRRTSQTAA